MSQIQGLPPTLERLVTVTNQHDLDGLVACFADDYRLVMPNHPSRNFVGPGQVRRNWEQFFRVIPDITTTIRAVAAGRDDQWWTEWEMTGTRLDGAPHLMRGVMIFTVGSGESDLIRANRFYVEPTDPEGSGSGIDAAVAALVGGGESR
ncbi:nuclear transport factor 2 family protein [Raineyella fluvialis]|uniref:Nuclear transport factor 2 family protein n=1 Tax=Raineyella fluvialis TaxID=2662261 RepID=A0A5Q2FHG9_9ACTN|nr:nuclear transport factor 2 family protein [Raineyella fluvialis]QGF24573.1 nuclear transport factor 2 family protein [Raineyella fluvialis]